METSILFSFANLLYLVGTIFLTKRVIKNRNALNDFDFHGSMINVIGMVVTAYAFIEIKSYMAVVISIPTMLFWAIVAIYSFNNRRTKNEKYGIYSRKL